MNESQTGDAATILTGVNTVGTGLPVTTPPTVGNTFTIEQYQTLVQDVERLKAERDRAANQYNGSRGLNAQLTTERDQLKGQLDALTQDYESKLTNLQAETENWKNKFTLRDQEAQEALNKLTEQDRRKSVRDFVVQFAEANQNPKLLEMWESGVLSDLSAMDDAARTDYLTRMTAFLTGVEKTTTENVRSGATPPPPPAGTSPSQTLADITKSMNEALQAKGYGSTEYQGLYQQYIRALTQG